jgi:DNA-binding CsgD family transcriptional regulator
VEQALEQVLRARECPHLAMLLRSPREVYAAQASFYGLAVRRNGWVLHRSVPGREERDRDGLRDAGLDVDVLERDGQMVIAEAPIEQAPDEWAQRWVAVADQALRSGFEAVWWTGPPIPSSPEAFSFGIAYDQAWERCIHDHPAVTLCLYIVEGLSEDERRARAEELGRFHDALLMSGPNGVSVLESLLAATGRREAPREEAPVVDLSARELEVLELMGEGLRNREIAERLVVSEATVKTHVRHVLEKLRMRNRAEAAAFAARWLPSLATRRGAGGTASAAPRSASR